MVSCGAASINSILVEAIHRQDIISTELVHIPLTRAYTGRRETDHGAACLSITMLHNHLCGDIECPTPGVQEVQTLVQWHVIRVTSHPLSSKGNSGHSIH